MRAVNALLDRIRRRRGVFAVGCLAVVALIAVGCGGDDDDDSGSSSEPTTVDVTFPFQDSIVWAGYEIARDPGGIYETDFNLKANTVATEGGSFVIQQLIAGQIDFGITGTPETMIAAAQGHDLVGIATIDSDIFTVVTTPDSGVSSIADLEGKALGVTDLGGGEIPLVNAVLDDAGLTPDEDVELKVIGPGGPAAAKAIQDGEVQAYAAAINDLAGIEATGVEFTPILDEKFTGLPNDQVVVRKEVLEDDETMQTILDVTKGMFQGTIYGDENPEEGLAIICELVPEDCSDEAVAQGFYEATLEGQINQARAGGAPDYDALTTVRDAIAAADNPAAADINLEEVFPDTFTEQLTP